MSSNAMPVVPGFRLTLSLAASAFGVMLMAPLAAQSDSTATTAPAPVPSPEPSPTPQPKINLLVTVPRGDVNEAQLQQCRNEADAGTVSGEIVVCRELGSDGTGLTGTRAESQKRYAQETAFKGAPPPPDLFGIPNGGTSIGFGKVPPPALIIDVAALPKAPAGSDADRIARGLPPTGQSEELSEEKEKARREAAGIKTTVPPRPKKKGG